MKERSRVTDSDDFIDNFLQHEYDPVKAHEYYLRNRELKKRKQTSITPKARAADEWKLEKLQKQVNAIKDPKKRAKEQARLDTVRTMSELKYLYIKKINQDRALTEKLNPDKNQSNAEEARTIAAEEKLARLRTSVAKAPKGKRAAIEKKLNEVQAKLNKFKGKIKNPFKDD